MNDWLLSVGLSSWKPVLTAFLLPPTPFLLLWIASLGLAPRRTAPMRLAGALLAAATWFSSCSGAAELLERRMLHLPLPLTPSRIAELRVQANDRVAIVVLGGGMESWAPEYNDSSLHFRSLERLRYGLWLSRQTHWPVAFSGGVGWGQAPASAVNEASVAQQIATSEFRAPLRWVESRSRDTRENAVNTVAVLKRDGISRILLVTHRWHMPRAVRDFEAAGGGAIRIEAAPIGLATKQELPLLRWVPSGEGLTMSRQVIRESLGLFFGA